MGAGNSVSVASLGGISEAYSSFSRHSATRTPVAQGPRLGALVLADTVGPVLFVYPAGI